MNGDREPGSAAAPAISVDLADRQNERRVDARRYADLLIASLSDTGVRGPAEVGLAFVDVDEMADLNRWHMHGDGPTDVLAFPIDGARAAPEGQPSVVGDIVICPEVAGRAPQGLDDELALLVVHGALHLLGHDHAEPDETAEMRAEERRLLEAHWRTP